MIAEDSRDVPFFRGTFFGKCGIKGIQFQQIENLHGVMGIHFEARRNLESSYV